MVLGESLIWGSLKAYPPQRDGLMSAGIDLTQFVLSNNYGK